MVRSASGVFLFEVLFYDLEYLLGMCGYFMCGWVPNRFKVGLVFGVGLEPRCGFEVIMVTFRALFV